MKNEEIEVLSYFFIRTSNFEILRFPLRVPIPAAHTREAKGVWWLPRSSKPLFRRGSVEGLVRFRRASAKKGRGQKAEGRGQKWGFAAFCLLPSALLLQRRVRQESHLRRAALVRGVHRLYRAIERHLVLGVDEDDALGRAAAA